MNAGAAQTKRLPEATGDWIMAIASSKLGRFVMQNGFSWPGEASDTSRDSRQVDEALVGHLRDTGLIRPDAANDEILETFRRARSEHAAAGYSPFNSPQERVRVFLEPYLTPKGRRWAEPLRSLEIPDDDSGEAGASSRWKFWNR